MFSSGNSGEFLKHFVEKYYWKTDFNYELEFVILPNQNFLFLTKKNQGYTNINSKKMLKMNKFAPKIYSDSMITIYALDKNTGGIPKYIQHYVPQTHNNREIKLI